MNENYSVKFLRLLS